MFHRKIDVAAAVPIRPEIAAPNASAGASAKLGAALIIAGLPLIALWLLARWLWSDVKAIGRGLALFYRSAAEEFSRSK